MTNPQTDRPSYGSAHAANVGNAGMKRPRGREIRPLASLLPYVLRRRMDLALAGVFLLLAAAANLAVPVAFRGVIDHGFAAGAEAAVDRAFLGLAGVALLMAVFSASRFYFVSKIGERIVADLRGDVYTHLLSRPPGYQEFLEAWRDPKHEDHKANRTWAGRSFDPEAFDIEKIQKAIRIALRRCKGGYRFRLEP